MALVVSAFVVCVPEIAFVPDQAPEAVQLVALVAAQVSFEVPPDATDVGDAVKVRVGAVPAVTVTVLDTDFVPPLPVQVNL